MINSIILVDPTASLTAMPDLNTLVVDVLEGEKIISVDQVRQAVNWLALRGFVAGRKRAIFMQAQRWHHTAPHMLLKTLEEPIDDTDIILTTDSQTSLLATIRSRCATYLIDEVSEAQLQQWGLQRQPPIIITVPQAWAEFTAQSALQRWTLSDQWLKAKHNLTELVQAWQQELLHQSSTSGQQAIDKVHQLYWLDQAQSRLRANVLPRLVFDELLLSLESR